MTQCYEIVADGRFNTGDSDPPGQASVYIPPGEDSQYYNALL